MTHQEIQDRETIERYVLHKLPPDQRRAFQEHYFACDECFEQVQTTAQFVAGVRDSAKRGVLAESATEAAQAGAASWWMNWFKPALVLPAMAALLLAVALGWVLFKRIPATQEEVAREHSETPRPPQESKNGEPAKSPTPNQPQDVAQNRPQTPAKSPTVLLPTVLLPTVLLDAARDAKAAGNQLTLPADAESARLVIEVAPDSGFDSFQLQLFESGNRLVTTVAGVKANAQGTLSVKVAARFLQNEKYLVKLYGVRGGRRELIGEYSLTVRKQ